jgi:predicted amidophosphoribosyltransferase
MTLGPLEFFIVALLLIVLFFGAGALFLLFRAVAGRGRRVCPYCKERIPRDATLCRYCGRESTPEITPIP